VSSERGFPWPKSETHKEWRLSRGARGIGFEVVRRFAQQDMMVVMTLVLAARDLDKAIAAFDTSRSWLML
jgi:hypothetical protein